MASANHPFGRSDLSPNTGKIMIPPTILNQYGFISKDRTGNYGYHGATLEITETLEASISDSKQLSIKNAMMEAKAQENYGSQDFDIYQGIKITP